MADEVDSIVKGAPAPGRDVNSSIAAAANNGDPLSHTPSSPSMIYLNLLILEASLRAQYLELRARRRHHTFFLLLLTAWIASFTYALFLAPREDGRGVGGSIYWAVEGAEKVCLMGGVITAVLVWATGIFDRGIRWPRRWLVVSNRGLRAFNCKLVIVKRPWWAEALSTLGFFLTYGLFHSTASSSYRHVDPAILQLVEKDLNRSNTATGGNDVHPILPIVVEDEERHSGQHRSMHHHLNHSPHHHSDTHEEDLAPGGDYVKLLLLAKPFSPAFRENWELYRTEYWEKENERRALLRARLKTQDRELARQQLGWFWWLPWRRQALQYQHSHARAHSEKLAHHPGHSKHLSVDRERKRRSSSVRRGSTSSSRSQTPAIETEDAIGPVARRPSGASTASEKRRKRSSLLAAVGGPAKSTVPIKRSESRSVTPDIPSSPLATETIVKEGEGVTRTLRHSASRSSNLSMTREK